jgi:nucleoside-diphosphate-sugar epimerase
VELQERTPLNIFVTAADSSFGLVLTRALAAAGHKVSGLAATFNGASGVRAAGGVPVFADISRASEVRAVMSMSKVDVVIHAAPAAFLDAPFARVNLDVDNHVVQIDALTAAAKAVGAKYFVYLSGAFIYGNHNGHMVQEDAKIATDTPLQKAALRAERAVMRSGVPYAILRLGFLFGPESPAMRTLEQVLRRSLPVAVDEAVVNWVHEADAAEAIRRVAEGRPVDQIFNVADDVPQSTLDFLNEFSAIIGLPSPKKSLQFLARTGLSAEQLAAIQMGAQANTNKIFKTLGWTPHFSTRRQGLEQVTLTWRAAEAVTVED